MPMVTIIAFAICLTIFSMANEIHSSPISCPPKSPCELIDIITLKHSMFKSLINVLLVTKKKKDLKKTQSIFFLLQ
jgi:hypothetical protein